jgi:predicted nucleic acid-binding protein
VKPVLVDTGPLVAILNRQDQFHGLCVETLRNIAGPLLSCWPVMTEAAWLLRENTEALERVLLGAHGSFLELAAVAGRELESIVGTMKKDKALRPQLADAVLVHLAERERIDTIFTLDHRDFSVYRTKRGGRFRLLPEKLR